MTTSTKTRALDLGSALSIAGKAIGKAGKAPKAKKAGKAPKAPKAAGKPVKVKAPSDHLNGPYAVKFRKAFDAARKIAKQTGKPVTSFAVSLDDMLSAISMTSLRNMAHHASAAKNWSDTPSLDARLLDDGKVKMTVHGASRYGIK